MPVEERRGEERERSSRDVEAQRGAMPPDPNARAQENSDRRTARSTIKEKEKEKEEKEKQKGKALSLSGHLISSRVGKSRTSRFDFVASNLLAATSSLSRCSLNVNKRRRMATVPSSSGCVRYCTPAVSSDREGEVRSSRGRGRGRGRMGEGFGGNNNFVKENRRRAGADYGETMAENGGPSRMESTGAVASKGDQHRQGVVDSRRLIKD